MFRLSVKVCISLFDVRLITCIHNNCFNQLLIILIIVSKTNILHPEKDFFLIAGGLGGRHYKRNVDMDFGGLSTVWGGLESTKIMGYCHL